MRPLSRQASLDFDQSTYVDEGTGLEKLADNSRSSKGNHAYPFSGKGRDTGPLRGVSLRSTRRKSFRSVSHPSRGTSQLKIRDSTSAAVLMVAANVS